MRAWRSSDRALESSIHTGGMAGIIERAYADEDVG